MKLVRGSEMSDFLRCRKRWNWRWNDGLVSKNKDGKLFFGTLFHKFAEVFYQYKNAEQVEIAQQAMWNMYQETDTSRMDQVELDGLMELISEVTDGYVQMWGERDKKWTVLATELTFAIPLGDDIAYAGTIDLIYLDEEGRLWIGDHKTTTSIERYRDNMVMDRQISRYLWAIQQLARGNGYILGTASYDVVGEDGRLTSEKAWIPVQDQAIYKQIAGKECYGFLYNIVSKDVPKQPKLLKPTKKEPVSLSIAKDQKTTYDMYLRALLENGLAYYNAKPDEIPALVTEDKYEEMLQHLKAQEDESGNRFFKRFEVRRHQEELDAAIVEFFAQAQESKILNENPDNDFLLYRNVTHDCTWDCPFKQLCIGSMDGSNAEALIGLFYEKEESEWPELVIN